MAVGAPLLFLLLLAFLALVLGSDAGERCSENGGTCPGEAAHDAAGLLQTRGRRQAAKGGPKKISIVKKWGAPVRRKPVEPLKARKETKEECSEVLSAVKGSNGISGGTLFWDFACQDGVRDHLSELKGGCLYLPRSADVKAFIKRLARINPWHLIGMLESSFFPFEDGKCPTDDMDKQVTGSDGAVYATCSDEPGFVAETGECTSVKLVASTPADKSNLKIYQLDGMMGLEPVWVRRLNTRDEPPPEALLAERSSKANVTGKSTTKVNVEVVVCDPGDGSVDDSVSDKQIKQQIKVMTKHFKGKDKCAAPTVYTPPSKDTKFRFKLRKISRVTNQYCGGSNDCYDFTSELVSQVVPYKQGTVKLLICDTAFLGFASYPWFSERIFALNPGTLPRGSITNYNEGDTCTHEMGHYLGLAHTFDNGCNFPGDLVNDTAAEEAPFFGCPTSAPTSCGGDVSDPVHNFMDYSDDRCICSFTEGQTTRMYEQLSLWSPDLL